MPVGALAPVARQQFFDNNGLPLEGGRLYTYAAGTDAPRAIYTDVTLATPHPNPAILDGAGRITIYLVPEQSYKFILKDKDDVFVWEQDSVTAAVAGGSGSAGGGASTEVLGTAGVDLAAAIPVYFDVDGRWYPARGDDPSKSTNARLVGMTVRAMPRDTRDTICLWGFVQVPPGVVAGVAYYIAPTGLLTTAAANARLVGYGDYDAHSLIVVQPTFQGTAPVTQPPVPPVGTAFQAQVLLVAGGGGGGLHRVGFGSQASGGGAGGLFDGVATLTPGFTYVGVVGAGGAAGASGSDSSVTGTATNLLVHGGGRGGHWPDQGALSDGANGGSGGGGWQNFGSGTPGEGFNGGKHQAGSSAMAGGGGRTGQGADYETGTPEGRSGGPGYLSTINGAAVTYACGGGGAYPFAFINNGNGGGGGLGGGGNGAHYFDNVHATAGFSPGSGGGGGATGDDGAGGHPQFPAGAGAGGICIVRYAGTPRATGGSITQSAGYTIHTFGVGAINLVVT